MAILPYVIPNLYFLSFFGGVQNKHFSLMTCIVWKKYILGKAYSTFDGWSVVHFLYKKRKKEEKRRKKEKKERKKEKKNRKKEQEERKKKERKEEERKKERKERTKEKKEESKKERKKKAKKEERRIVLQKKVSRTGLARHVG